MQDFRSSFSMALTVALALGVAGCSTSSQEQGQATGSLSLALSLGDGADIDEVTWLITGGDMDPMSGSIDVSAPGSTPSVEVFGLPPTAGKDYTITLTATSDDEKITCSGSADFGVDAGEVTEVEVMLNCTLPDRLGGVRVNGEFNVCAELTKVVVSPLQTSIDNEIDLEADAIDLDDDDDIEYRWRGTGGSIDDFNDPSTTYTCRRDGDHEITIEVSDDGFEDCVGSWTVRVTCVGEPAPERAFNRVSSFLVCSQLDENCDDDTETASEIVAASSDGNTLVYTDSPLEAVGFVDITNPAAPEGLGTLGLDGEPTSVAVTNQYALIGVNKSTVTELDCDDDGDPDSVEYIATWDGQMTVVDLSDPSNPVAVETIELGGQPDSVAVSPDGRYAAIAIENERNEDVSDGSIPQGQDTVVSGYDMGAMTPCDNIELTDSGDPRAGNLVIIDLVGDPDTWATRTVDLTDIADFAPTDPEPEFVDINEDNIAVVTLQENNHIVLVDLANGRVTADFSARTVDLTGVDLTEDDPAINDNLSIIQNEAQANVPREPDGVTWIDDDLLATADEGDLDGGSRGFTIFNTSGRVVFSSGNANDRMTARLGHYPDERSGNKGNEPENADYGVYGDDELLIVASERSSVLFVYDLSTPFEPALKQVLPAGVGPEGILALTSRNLLIAASEEDNRGDKIRSVLNIYAYTVAAPSYPTIVSTNRDDGSPIPWAAMSGLGADGSDTLYAVEDSFYGANRIFGIDISTTPAVLDTEIAIKDTDDVFAKVPTDDDGEDDDVFSSKDLAALINADKTVNIDPEGIAVASDGGFWVASEGSGTVGNPNRPVTSLNFVFKTDANGVIEAVVLLPDDLNAAQFRFGFEGIAEYDGAGWVAFQRRWPNADRGHDPGPRIGRYDLTKGEWTFFFYPLDAPESQNGGWVGLSDLTSLGDGTFLVVERDNQGGPDAAIKRLYTFSVDGLHPGETVKKQLLRDLIDEGDLTATNGLIAEKIEGSAVSSTGDVYIINDNDGVDDNSGETNLINLGDLL